MEKVYNSKIRTWGTIAHIPVITIIWLVYIAYTYNWSLVPNGTSLDTLLLQFSTIPTRPIIFTLLSLPISLSIMFLKKSSSYIRINAEQAFYFNIWLLRRYFISAIGVLLALYFSLKLVVILFELFVAAITINCLIQSLMGVTTAARGMVYRYWYPPLL